MMVLLESARSAVYGAARWPMRRPCATRCMVAALARCEAHEAALFCAQEAIQLHGGVGFTWEYDPHLYFKRAQAATASAWAASGVWRERTWRRCCSTTQWRHEPA
jgi:alkylation response protein AidB-like acyl-CoA dehydrogenase